jgi:N6-L-threonylcarbamoyladenine synthase
MLVLAIDTSTKSSSVSVFDDKKGVLAELTLNIKLNHSDTLMKAVDTVFKFSEKNVSEIDRIAVGTGPGSFTGIRVGVGAAKGLAYSTGADIVGVNELDALASMVTHTDMKIIPLIDARKERVYYCEYTYDAEGKLKRERDYGDAHLEELLDSYSGKVIFTGDGSVNYRDKIIGKMGERAYFNRISSSCVKSSILAELSLEMEPDNLFILEPFYHSKTQAERMKAAKKS